VCATGGLYSSRTKAIRAPCEGKPHVRCDEGTVETESMEYFMRHPSNRKGRETSGGLLKMWRHCSTLPETLAYLLRADLISEAYLREKSNLQKQKILRMRSFYVKLRTQVKNRVHALIDGQVEEIREVAKGYSDLFGKGGLQWLSELRLNGSEEKMLRGLLEVYELLCKQVRATDKIVKEIVESDEDCELLKSIPGIGAFFAVLIKIEIGDIERFPSSSKLCSYAGIVPSTYASGGKVWHGRLTKQGNRWLRWAIVEAVKPAISSNGELRSYYERIRYKKGP